VINSGEILFFITNFLNEKVVSAPEGKTEHKGRLFVGLSETENIKYK